MDGVNILATNIVSSGDSFLGGFVIVVSFIFSIIILWCSIEAGEPSMLFFLLLAGLFIAFGVSLIKTDVKLTQYIVTVSESVSMKDFNDKYTLISQEGQLYTIEEKVQ